MKRLLIAPLILLLTSCSYGSFYEAQEACEEWRDKGGSYKFERERKNIKNETYITISSNRLRDCLNENETNQILGFQYFGCKKGDFVKLGPSKRNLPNITQKVVKRFKY